MKAASTMRGRLRVLALVLLVAGASASVTHGQQQSPSAARAVQQAAFDRAETGGERETVRFGRRTACVGDKIEQRLTLEVRLSTSLRHGNELVEKNQTLLRAGQRRVVATTAVERDRAMAVRVHYLEATRQLTASDFADASPPVAQCVQGKTYHCRRAAGEEGQLIITDATGQTPPPDELEIVAQHMEMVGRANPLAEFLAGRRVTVGETIALPKELAAQLFNLGDRFGEATRFDLTLERMETRDGVACAVFRADVEAASNDSSQMRMQIEGPLIIQVDTCRAVQLALSGPIGMSETRGSYSTIHHLLGTGQLKMSIESAYRDAAQ